MIRRPPLTLLQFKCFLRCKDWEKLKLILSLLVRGRERKEKGREGKEKGENIREGIVPQFCAPKKHELLFCAIDLVNSLRLMAEDH